MVASRVPTGIRHAMLLPLVQLGHIRLVFIIVASAEYLPGLYVVSAMSVLVYATTLLLAITIPDSVPTLFERRQQTLA